MVNIAVSLGGTKLSVAIVYPDGKIDYSTNPLNWREKFYITEKEEHAVILTGQIFKKIKKAIKEAGLDEVNIVGLSTKGPMAEKDGTKILGPGEKLTTLPYRDYPLEEKLEKLLFVEFKKYIEVKLLHDGAAAILGEVSNKGTLAHKKDACAVIIGTGIGLGVVQNGKLYTSEDSQREYGFDKGLDGLGRYVVYFVYDSGCGYENRINRTKGGKAVLQEGEVHFSERAAGPWLARRLANALADDEKFLAEIGIKKTQIYTYLGIWYRKDNKKNTSTQDEAKLKNIEKTLLKKLTTAAKKKNAAAREFIISVAEEIGCALAEFIYVFQRRKFVENIVLVSAVAENLGKGINGNSDDLFIEKIREKVKVVLKGKDLPPENAKKLSEGIVRSRISYEREFLAFMPSPSKNSKSDDDKALAIKNLIEAFKLIKNKKRKKLEPAQKKEIMWILGSLFWDALPYFRKGAMFNPIYHHTQVLVNMIRIGLGEKLSYSEFKNATILALLHDIGNAISIKEKVTNSKILEKEEEEKKEGTGELLQEVKDLVDKSMAFRLEHMDKGPQLIREITKQFVDKGILREEDLHFICRAVSIHDYPSIEMSLKEIREIGIEVEYAKGDFLLPFDNSPFGRLITFLREADRLFMVSEQGIIKDLIDSEKEQTPANKLEKLRSNKQRHIDEYKLYIEANKDDGEFKEKTLYRTVTGYSIFAERVKEVEKESV